MIDDDDFSWCCRLGTLKSMFLADGVGSIKKKRDPRTPVGTNGAYRGMTDS